MRLGRPEQDRSCWRGAGRWGRVRKDAFEESTRAPGTHASFAGRGQATRRARCHTDHRRSTSSIPDIKVRIRPNGREWAVPNRTNARARRKGKRGRVACPCGWPLWPLLGLAYRLRFFWRGPHP